MAVVNSFRRVTRAVQNRGDLRMVSPVKRDIFHSPVQMCHGFRKWRFKSVSGRRRMSSSKCSRRGVLAGHRYQFSMNCRHVVKVMVSKTCKIEMHLD
jgi:hypothetical protein